MKIYSVTGKKNICSNQVYRLRTAARMTQFDLATLMQNEGVAIEREAISKIETADRYVADFELRAIAKIFKLDINDLLEGDE